MIHKIKDLVVKKKVKIVFEDGLEIFITQDNYLRSGFLFPGKLIDEKTLDELLYYESDEIYRNYLRSLIKKRQYSTYQLMVRLIEKKELDPKKARKLVGDLEREGLVSDENFIIAKIDTMRYRGFSPKRIKDYLRYEAKITQDLIEKYEDEIENVDEDMINEIIESAFNRESQYPLRRREERAISKLMAKGFAFTEARNQVKKYITENELLEDEKTTKNTAIAILDRQLAKRDVYPPPKRNMMLVNDLRKVGFDYHDAKDYVENYVKDIAEEDLDLRLATDADRIMVYNISRLTTSPAKKKQTLIRKLMNLGYAYRDVAQIIKEKNYDFN